MAVIKDVAGLAEVSVGTVSKYLNNPDSLKAKTRERVERAIKELHYSPSPLARSMRTGKTGLISVITPNISNPFFVEVFNSIRTNAVSNGLTATLMTIEDDFKVIKNYLDNISKNPVDGLILCFVDQEQMIDEYVKELQDTLPVVLLSWDIEMTRLNRVCIDVCEGMYKATDYLLKAGHRRIAYAGGYSDNRISAQKFQGFCDALKEAGLDADPKLVFNGPLKMQNGYYTARKIMDMEQRPDAVVAENDNVGLGCLKYFSQCKLEIPDDIALIGFDNIMLSAMYEPALSTVSLPISDMGEEAVKLLREIIDNPSVKNRLTVLGTELVIRSSTDKSAPVELDF